MRLKKKSFWNNGGRFYEWLAIIIILVGLIGNTYVKYYRDKETCERSKKNEERAILNDKRLAVVEKQIETLVNGQEKILELLQSNNNRRNR